MDLLLNISRSRTHNSWYYYLSCVLYPGAWLYTKINKKKSVIIPVIKDKHRRVTEKGNYRPICFSNICSKIIDAVLFNRTDTYLQIIIQQNGYVLTNYYSTERIRTCKLLFNRTDTYLQIIIQQNGYVLANYATSVWVYAQTWNGAMCVCI